MSNRDPYSDLISAPLDLRPRAFQPCGYSTTTARRKEPNMMIIGVDYHPSFQAMAFLMEETGECGEQELNHSDG